MPTMLETRKYKRVYDTGHSWLAVPLSHLIAEGFQPSRFSYIDNQLGFAYLEEDLDAPNFLHCLYKKQIEVIQVEIRLDYPAHIRMLMGFDIDWLERARRHEVIIDSVKVNGKALHA